MARIAPASIVAITFASSIISSIVAGCGESILDPSYPGPTLGVISGTVPALQGMVAANPTQVHVVVANSERLANSVVSLGQFRTGGSPASFTLPITVMYDLWLRSWARYDETGDQGPVTVFALFVTGQAEPMTEEGLALDDFIAYAPRYSDHNEVQGFASQSGPVIVPRGYSHVRRPCVEGRPGPAEVFPLDGGHPVVFTTAPVGTSRQLRVRARSCADLPLPQPQP